MPDPISAFSRRDRFWDGDPSHRDDLVKRIDPPNDEHVAIDDDVAIAASVDGEGLETPRSPPPKISALRPAPGILQHLPPTIATLLQPAFDRLAETNGGHRLDVSQVAFVVKDLGGPPGHTVRDVVEIAPSELERPLLNQLYTIGHELTHVLQFERIGASGADADTRWALMEARYAAEARGPGRGSQYDVPPGLTFTGLNVLDRRFTLESMAVRVGSECKGRVFD